METNIDQLREQFEKRFGRSAAGFARAPGRVNLIGEHTDYNDGFVLPIAIERETVAMFSPRKDLRVRFVSLQAEEAAELDLADLDHATPGEPAWANYCKGVAYGLFLGGEPMPGADVLLSSNVPLGAGLSSSAALEVSTAKALLASAGTPNAVHGMDLALVCQTAEHEWAGAPCGIMDQAIAVLGRQGSALLLDCRYGKTRQIAFDDPEVVLLVADTQVRHSIAGGEYAQRRQECQQACSEMNLKSLRDAELADIQSAETDGRLGKPRNHRARHVVSEIKRTLEAAEALQLRDHERFGRLMYESHASLRDDYEVSCEELDEIVELAAGRQGVYGARMTGGGFGGSAIILARAADAEAIADAVATGFESRFGRRCPIFATRAAQGATVTMFE